MDSRTGVGCASAVLCLGAGLVSGCGGDGTGDPPRVAVPKVSVFLGSDEPSPGELQQEQLRNSDSDSADSGNGTDDTDRNGGTDTDPGGDGAPAARGAPTAQGKPRAPGAPKPPKQSKKGAHGAPIRVPARVNEEGEPVGGVVSRLRADIREQCGGTNCVTLVVVPPKDGDKRCELLFFKTVPEPGTRVERGSTIQVTTTRASCTPEPAPSSKKASPSPSPEAGSP